MDFGELQQLLDCHDNEDTKAGQKMSVNGTDNVELKCTKLAY